MPLVDKRFWAKVDKRGDDDCWWWQGATNEGYGRFFDGKGSKAAHRWAYENIVGPIPDGLVIDHLCRNRGCVNPAHMEPVTDRENILRGEGRGAKQARQTRCKRGHPLEGDNLYNRPDGSRQCRACLKLAEQRRTERNANRQNWKHRAEAADAAVATTRQALAALDPFVRWIEANYPKVLREMPSEEFEAAAIAVGAGIHTGQAAGRGRLTPDEALGTPLAFRDELLELAGTARGRIAA